MGIHSPTEKVEAHEMNWSAAVILLLGSASCSFSAAIRSSYYNRHYGIGIGRLNHGMPNQRYNIHRAKLIYGNTIKKSLSNQQEVSPIKPLGSTVQAAVSTKTVEFKAPSVSNTNDKIILFSTEARDVELSTTESIPVTTAAPLAAAQDKTTAATDVFELDRSVINLRALVSVEEANEETTTEDLEDSIFQSSNDDILETKGDGNFISENMISEEIAEPLFIDPSIPFLQPAAPSALDSSQIPVSLSFLQPVPAVPGLPVRSQPDAQGFVLIDELPGQVIMQVREVVLKPVPAVPGLPVLNP